MLMQYDKQAMIWEEALPLGNGRIGAMVWSGVETEKISLNDDTLWSGHPVNLDLPDKSAHFKKARDLAMAGKYDEVQDYIEAHMLGPYTQGYLPLGDLLMEMDSDGSNATNYARNLDLDKAIVSASYQQEDVTYKRECFVNAPHQVMVMRISANKPAAISFKARFACQLRSKSKADKNRLILKGVAPSIARPSYSLGDNPLIYNPAPEKQGMEFIAVADFEVRGGKYHQDGEALVVECADEIIIRLCCRTSFNGPFRSPKLEGAPYVENCEKDLLGCLSVGYKSLLNEHIEDYQQLYNRVEISFGGQSQLENTPLPKRLANWHKAEEDPALIALLFQYARYLMISGSRPGTVPLNLQGIWNPHVHPPWSSNYTININTEMNYWPAESVNLSECHKPLFDLLHILRKTGAASAKSGYGAKGYMAGHNSDIWGLANLVGEGKKGNAVYAFWPVAAGWLSAHAYEHYLYTLDRKFLQEDAWPIIKEAAAFYLDVLTEDTDGTLIFAPSTSPENSFIFNENRQAISKTATMTTAIIRETLENTLHCCEVLGLDDDIAAKAASAVKRLPGYKIGAKGQFMEWSEDLPEAEPAHRHTSHLYPLYPGRDIKPGTPLGDACARTLDLRGEEATGWAIAWRICLWARLHEAKRAFDCLKKQFRPATDRNGGCYPNLFGAHPPFQIDSNFGAAAGIVEMIMQSFWLGGDDVPEIHLLPALPTALGNGYVQGLRAKGGITVSVYFEGGKLQKAEFVLDAHLPAKEIAVKYNGTVETLHLQPGIEAWIKP